MSVSLEIREYEYTGNGATWTIQIWTFVIFSEAKHIVIDVGRNSLDSGMFNKDTTCSPCGSISAIVCVQIFSKVIFLEPQRCLTGICSESVFLPPVFRSEPPHPLCLG